jgi:tripartite-type tricarboxylate transporter receptor subunit TctC
VKTRKSYTDPVYSSETKKSMTSIGPARLGSLALTVALAAVPIAAAADYPVKPIRVLVGFIAGGGSDIAARSIAVNLSETFGQSVVVDNRPGATGSIAAEIAARLPKYCTRPM